MQLSHPRILVIYCMTFFYVLYLLRTRLIIILSLTTAL